jgi:hypothetical protein
LPDIPRELSTVITGTLELLIEEKHYLSCPTAVFTAGDTIVARVSSTEFLIIVVETERKRVSIAFETIPKVAGLMGGVYNASDLEGVASMVRDAYTIFCRGLADRGVYPFASDGSRPRSKG